jgi:hypothetical protein
VSSIVQRSLPGIVLTIIALAVAAAVSAGTNLNVAWHELALLALGLAAVVSLALAVSPGVFRPLASPGLDVSDIYVRTGEIERRTTHLEDRGSERRRYLWNLLPLTIAIAVIAVSAFAL